MPNKEENKALFLGLTQMLGASAMQQLGKIINPMTGKTEISLEGAQATIDLLSMLREKTRGNLDKDEERLLDNLLSSLQLNYVETASAAPAEQPKPAEGDTKDSSSADAAGGNTQSAKDQKKDEEEPRFHKSYG